MSLARRVLYAIEARERSPFAQLGTGRDGQRR